MARGTRQPAPGNQWITCADFTPGIQKRLMRTGYGNNAPAQQPGIATPNTFRCIALPGGGLGPLPKRQTAVTINAQEAASGVVNGRFTISGLHIAGPVLATPAAGLDPAEAHMAFEWVTNAGARKWVWTRQRLWESPVGQDVLRSVNPSTETSPAAQMRPTFFHNFRAHNSDATQPGNPIVAAAWYGAGGGNEKYWSLYPNPAVPGANGLYDVDTTRAIEHLIGHQGRSVGFQQLGWAHGMPGTWSFNEQIFFTNSNLKTLSSAVAQVFGQENATGYAAVASLNSQELFLLKLQGGAYLVRGDIANPQVLRLPGVVSPGNANHEGASTPIGFVYGTRDRGVWAWNGGETADYLSPQLDTDFWLVTPHDFIDYCGSFEMFGEYVLTPNNWLYDYNRKSWWRIEDPTSVAIMQWSPSVIGAQMYGAPAYYVDNTTPALYYFSPATPASTYQWESQPIPQTMGTVSIARELIIIGQGQGTITVTVTSQSGSTVTKVFTLANTGFPEEHRANINVRGTHMQVKVVAANGSSPAPILYEWRLGIHTDAHHIAAE